MTTPAPSTTVPAGADVGPNTLVGAALAFYAYLSQLSDEAALSAAEMWDELDPNAIRKSWIGHRLTDRMLLTTSVAQQQAAVAADYFVRHAAMLQGVRGTPELLAHKVFAGIASDGRNLDDLLRMPLIRTMGALGAGAAAGTALYANRERLARIVKTQVLDAGRAAEQVAMAGHEGLHEWVRMLVPPSCSRCVVLAGRVYKTDAGFDRHPYCFPAGTVVSGPVPEAATRRWYEGELVIVRTASGEKLSVTGNHPVLTDRGWIPAHLLVEGGYVVRSTRRNGAVGLLVPHERQMPTPIEQVWGAHLMGSLRRVPTSPEDFHGDGGHGDVDVVLADGPLRNRVEAPVNQESRQGSFPGRVELAAGLEATRSVGKPCFGALRASDGVMGGRRLSSAFGCRHLAGPGQSGGTPAAELAAMLLQSATDGRAAHAETTSDSVLAFASRIRGGNGAAVDVGSRRTRWDAPSGSFSMESRVRHASVGEDLRNRLSGQVELDRVVEVERVHWSGHVYNLTSSEGWYCADGLIVSNCDCIAIPAVEAVQNDARLVPERYFASLSPTDQDKYFTAAGAEAIRSGADIGQVVNARRGAAGLEVPGRLTADEAKLLRGGHRKARLGRVDVHGRPLHTTSEGTTRRGLAGQRLIAEEQRAGATSSRAKRAQTPRLMPEAILQVAGTNKDQQRDLLRRFGYLL